MTQMVNLMLSDDLRDSRTHREALVVWPAALLPACAYLSFRSLDARSSETADPLGRLLMGVDLPKTRPTSHKRSTCAQCRHCQSEEIESSDQERLDGWSLQA